MAEFEVFPPSEWSESSEESSQGQREKIERLVGEAYATLKLRNWASYTRKVSELSLYPRRLVEDTIREKMGKVEPHRAKQLARIQEDVTAFPQTQQSVVDKPELQAKWREWGIPEPTIQALVKQHKRVTEARKLEKKIRTPQLNYLVPLLPRVKEKAEVVAMAIDTDGWLDERKTGGDRIGKIDRWVYRWEYTVPALGFSTEDYGLTEHIANMLNTAVTPVRTVRLGKAKIMYRTVAWTSRAMRTIQLCEPHFIASKQRARQYLKKYKSKPSQPIPK